jgi:hydrogenase expression/formation protein HypE
MTASLEKGLGCPTPRVDLERVQLGHGSGGKMSAALLERCFLPHLANDTLSPLGDAAVFQAPAAELAFSTDTFVVHPLEFPGGDIGSLAVHGTVNDLAMMGATPRYLSVGFVLEEGLEIVVLERIVRSLARAARECGVPIATGDTKVVERGLCDGLYLNTAGIGAMMPGFAPSPALARAGDVIIVSGPLGRHGMAIMAAREGLQFEAEIQSDSAPLHHLVAALREAVGEAIHVMRDPTRGGVASALNEIAATAGVGMVLEERSVPIPGPVEAACEMLGLDPLYVANEGLLVALIAADAAESALEVMRAHLVGAEAVAIGRVVDDHPGLVVLDTRIGGRRVVDMLPGDQLPRIC